MPLPGSGRSVPSRDTSCPVAVVKIYSVLLSSGPPTCSILRQPHPSSPRSIPLRQEAHLQALPSLRRSTEAGRTRITTE